MREGDMADIRGDLAGWPERWALSDVEVGWGPPVGDRVRIRPDLDHRCPEGAHDGEERGHTGIVMNVRRTCGASAHAYLVLFDDPHPVIRLADHGVPVPARHYAAIELEPAD
jgi:hypothetical protein